MKSKTIIISSQNGGSGRGILTLYDENDLLKCKLRLYGVEKLNRYAKIGIYHNAEVYTANLIERSGVYESSLVGNFDMNGDFYCAIIKTDKNNEVVLSGGTYAGFYFNDNSVFDENDEINQAKSNNELQASANKEENVCGNYSTSDKCANCKYKEYFYNENKIDIQNAADENNEPAGKNEKEDNKKNLPTILEQIIPQFDYIFENFPQNAELNSKIENGKFVNMNDGEYSLGAIYEQDEIKYICYAVKCKYNTPAPEELGKYYQWLALDSEDPLSDGYYIVFQDAKDLKIIEV